MNRNLVIMCLCECCLKKYWKWNKTREFWRNPKRYGILIHQRKNEKKRERGRGGERERQRRKEPVNFTKFKCGVKLQRFCWCLDMKWNQCEFFLSPWNNSVWVCLCCHWKRKIRIFFAILFFFGNIWSMKD